MKNKNLWLVGLFIGLLVGCGSGSDSASTGMDLSSKEGLGQHLFNDKDLSLTRQTSCATCHDADHAFIDARFREAGKDQTIFVHGALSVGDDDISLGGRNAPTAMYGKFSPAFDVATVKGGQFHDGRAATLKDQAMGPPLDMAEMMMPNRASVVERLQEKPEVSDAFKKLYGETIFEDVDAAYEAMADAIAKFEKTEEFSPFTSKYDKLIQCKASGKLTSECLKQGNWNADEDLGMSLFFSEANTNCATCHQLQSQSIVANETFTDYTYHNIGTPKNIEAIQRRHALGQASANPTEHGVFGATPAVGKANDGAIKVPTLRNVAVSGPYMHNGVFQNLKTVLEFYDHMGSGIRANNPETGTPWGTTDVPSTINHADLNMPALSDRKIQALEAFLKTLTDARYEHLVP